MSRLVIDASVAAKWFFPEEHSAAAMRLLSPRNTLLAPDLIWAEVANIAWKRHRRKEITLDEARAIVADLVRMPLEIVRSSDLLPAAFDLAAATGRTVYDSLYLALAIARRAKFVTADERLVNALAGTGLEKRVRLVG